MVEFLLPMKLQILTNSLALAQALVGSSANTVILSGRSGLRRSVRR
jgi:DeoR/GlpR family transcriptional regulator of sugar metabolism